MQRRMNINTQKGKSISERGEISVKEEEKYE